MTPGKGVFIIPGEDGSNLVPSVVALDQEGHMLVGNAAREVLLNSPERAVYSVKRLMGRGVEDVQEELKLFPFHLADDLAAGEVLRIKSGRADVYASGDFGADSASAQAQRRTVFRRAGEAGGDHGAGILQRCAAAGDQGCRTHRGAGSAAAGERADGGFAGLWVGPEAERHHRGV